MVAKTTLCYVLDICFRLLHPFMPFITEYLWQRLPSPYKNIPALIVAQWPVVKTELISDAADETFTIVKDLIEEIRSVRNSFHFPPGDRIAIYIESGKNHSTIEQGKADIISLARINPDQFYLDQSIEPQGQVGHLVVHGMEVQVSLGKIDINAEIARIKIEVAKIDASIEKGEKMLNGSFAQRAPKEIVQAERVKLRENQEKKQKLSEQIAIIQPTGAKPPKTPVKRPTKPKAKQSPKPKLKPSKK
ncbi:MAG: valyl-tRNA synthetase [Promethearchaeota archaeon CR_4]|nr:MAG: valyl-tRNA synthetase [Candidatus Lokiarchaeota archaeon CR_4]